MIRIEEIKAEAQAAADLATAEATAAAEDAQAKLETVMGVTVEGETIQENFDTIKELAEGKADKYTTQNSATGSFTITTDHIGEHILCNSTGTISVTITNDTAIPLGSEVSFMRQGTGTVQFVVSGVTLRSPESKVTIKDQYGTAALMKISDTEWVLAGNLG